MPVIICPGCSTRLKVDSQPSGKFACPKCKKVMRLASTSSSEPGQSTVDSKAQSEAQSTFPSKEQPNKLPDPSILGELALLQLPGYVQGSFKISPDQKNLTLQYRGSDKNVALHYAMVLPGDAGIMVGFEPSFIGND